jgi:hypothetical protein
VFSKNKIYEPCLYSEMVLTEASGEEREGRVRRKRGVREEKRKEREREE